jgi:hypothetical protein
VAEWLRSGLQSRLHRFDSGRRLGRVPVPAFSFTPSPALPARPRAGRALGVPTGRAQCRTSRLTHPELGRYTRIRLDATRRASAEDPSRGIRTTPLLEQDDQQDDDEDEADYAAGNHGH